MTALKNTDNVHRVDFKTEFKKISATNLSRTRKLVIITALLESIEITILFYLQKEIDDNSWHLLALCITIARCIDVKNIQSTLVITHISSVDLAGVIIEYGLVE